MYEIVNTQTFNKQALEQNIREGYHNYLDSNNADLLIKYSLMVAELYDVLEMPEQSAQWLIKIGNQIPKVPHYVALFFEQAAFNYLKKKMYRKFAYYTMQAALNYNVVGYIEYALNCF